MSQCTFSMLAGPGDAAFLDRMARHVVGAHAGKLSRRTLVVDTCTDHRGAPGPERIAAVLCIAERLVADGVIDAVVGLQEFHATQNAVLGRHFRPVPRTTRDFRGVPLAGWVAGIEAAPASGPYHLHFDSDMLIHDGGDWIDDAVRLMEETPDILCAAPHPGPPVPDRNIHQPEAFETSARAWIFRGFTCRAFLVHRGRLASLLPLRPARASRRLAILAALRRRSAVLNWEILVSNAMQQAGLKRAHLRDPSSWTLHAPDHGHAFVRALPGLIEGVERGEAPPGQRGHYDLVLDAWE